MTDQATFQIPEQVFAVILVSWIVACGVAFVAGYFVGASQELRKRLK